MKKFLLFVLSVTVVNGCKHRNFSDTEDVLVNRAGIFRYHLDEKSELLTQFTCQGESPYTIAKCQSDPIYRDWADIKPWIQNMSGPTESQQELYDGVNRKITAYQRQLRDIDAGLVRARQEKDESKISDLNEQKRACLATLKDLNASKESLEPTMSYLRQQSADVTKFEKKLKDPNPPLYDSMYAHSDNYGQFLHDAVANSFPSVKVPPKKVDEIVERILVFTAKVSYPREKYFFDGKTSQNIKDFPNDKAFSVDNPSLLAAGTQYYCVQAYWSYACFASIKNVDDATPLFTIKRPMTALGLHLGTTLSQFMNPYFSFDGIYK